MELLTVLLCGAITAISFCLFHFFCDADLTVIFYELFGQPLKSAEGKVYWIVGASSGIGEYLAYELIANGAKLVLSARRESELQKVKEQCLEKSRKAGRVIAESDIFILPFDITKLEVHKQHFDSVLQHFGSLDVLVNNAGRSQRATWMDIDIQVDRDLFDTNVFGLLNLSRVVVPYFVSKKQGHIAVTSSIAGKFGAPCSASYNASKHALHAYFETLRCELAAQNISVTMICPGPVFSNFLGACATGKPGKTLGATVNQNDRRMATDRCAKLCLVSILNKVDEAWISLQPTLFFFYFAQYAPTLFRSFLSKFGAQLAMKIRDSNSDHQ